MNDGFRKKINSFTHPNKEFEKKTIMLFNNMLDEEERIENEYNESHPGELGLHRGLDGGTASDRRKVHREYFKKFKELKEEYNIVDVKAP